MRWNPGRALHYSGPHTQVTHPRPPSLWLTGAMMARMRLQGRLALAGATIALITWAGTATGLNANTMGFAYLIVVLLISAGGGLVTGTICSLAATLCYNFFFFPPLHTLIIEQPANWFALTAFLVASVTVNRLVVAARIQASTAGQRQSELETLYRLSVDLFAATNRAGSLGDAVGRALQLFGAQEGGLVLLEGDRRVQVVAAWNGDRPRAIEERIDETARRCEPTEVPTTRGRDVYLPLVVSGVVAGVLVARNTAASQEALQPAARLVALALERQRFIDEAAHLQALRESDALKTSLLRAISHDLTTPVTAIAIRTESLRRHAVDDDLRDDVRTIAEETNRLRRRIENLLAMARLEAGQARPRPEPTPPADLFRAVRENLSLVFHERQFRVKVESDCPDAFVDPSLMLEILTNVVENAHRVSPAESPIELHARALTGSAARVLLEVLDRGPGVPLALQVSDLTQRGLGLEIARSLAAANGGTVSLEPRDGGGTTVRIDVPAAPLPGQEN